MNIRPEPLTIHSDARGVVFEPLTAAELAEQRNVHVVLTEPGHVRGNHYHLRGTEIVAVLGPALVRIKGDGGLRDFEIASGQAVRLTIPAGVAHAFQNTGQATGILIGFNTMEHDPDQPNVVREVLIET